MTSNETMSSDRQYYRLVAGLCIGLVLGLLLGYIFFHQKNPAIDKTEAEKAGQQAAIAFQKGLAEELQKTFTAPEPDKLSRDTINWMEDISTKPPNQIAPHELCVLFAKDGYYQRVLNYTEAQSEAMYEKKYKGKTSNWFEVYVADTSSRSIDGVWPLSPNGFPISFRASFPLFADEPDLTRINKGEIWVVEGKLSLLFADTGKIWLDNCRLIGKFKLPSSWNLGDPLKLTPDMFIPLEDI